MQTDLDWMNPEGDHRHVARRPFEEFAGRLMARMPEAELERTRDSIQLSAGGERGVVILITPEAMEIRLPTMDWPRPYMAVPSSRLWKRLQWARLSEKRMMKLIEEARQVRAAEFVPCRFCGKEFPPERRADDACHSCASKHLGIVY